MFNSTKLRDFSTLHLASDVANESTSAASSFIQPKITSTPMRRDSIFATPPKPRVLTPRSYSLSEVATPPRVNRRDSIRAGSHQNSPGPLLASTKYNVSVSTYEDTKTPGLAGRIVRYHEEAEQEKEHRSLPTHQAKYGSPGLFPIVHLFKKKLPVLEQKPRHVTVRIASPNNGRQHSQDYQRQLLGSIIKPGNISHTKQSNMQNSSSPRSVLDALKEISRKRIHATEVVENHEDNNSKRIRTENGDIIDSNKRQRDKSPPSENIISPTKPVLKKICMYDEYAASRSSMDFSVLKKPEPPMPKRKSISIHTLTDSPKESKQIKLVNAGTQTPAAEADKSTNTKAVPEEPNPAGTQTEQDAPVVEKRAAPLKVFDDAPLERIRKNRLAALLGSLAGVDPVLEPKPDKASLLQDDAESAVAEKPLVSILTPSHKSLEKLKKHVHFDIPESTGQSTESSSSPALITPIAPLAPPSSPVEPAVSSNSPGISAGASSTPSFSLGSTVLTSAPVLSFGKAQTDVVSSAPIPSFNLSKAPSTANLATLATSTVVPDTKSSPPKMGGFKFDLNKPSTANTAAAGSVGSFPSATEASSPKLSFGKSSSSTAVASPTPSFSFGPKPAAATVGASSTRASFGSGSPSALVSTSIVSSSSAPSKAGGIDLSSTSTTFAPNPPASVPPPFGASSAEAVKPPMFSFGGGAVSSPAPSFAFGPAKTTAVAVSSTTSSISDAGFGVANPGFGTTPSSGFGTAPGSVLGGFATTAETGFGSASSNKPTPTFGAVTTTAPPAYGTSSAFASAPAFWQENLSATKNASTTNAAFNQTGFVGSTSTSQQASFGGTAVTQATSFGGTAVTQATSFGGTAATQATSFGGTAVTQATSFGGTAVTQATSFGVPTTASAPFGSAASTAVSAFGNNAVPATFSFGPKTTASTTFGGFGATTTANSTFGSGFAAPATTTNAFSGFGGTPATTAGNTFGGFGTTTTTASNMFGSFGTTSSTTNAGFGTPTTTPSFGGGTTTNTGFGATTTTPSFGGSNSFGTTQASTFGTSSPAGFGASAKASSFGATNMPGFGGFGTAAAPASTPFGAPAPGTAFNSPTTTGGFGSTGAAFAKPAANNAFGGPSSAGTAFGTTQAQPFGTANPATTQGGVFSFGGAGTAPKPGGVFSFGSTAPADKPKFDFGGAASPAFGAAGSPYGGTAPAYGVPQNAVAGTFSIGSGSQSSGRNRAQIKAKRRT